MKQLFFINHRNDTKNPILSSESTIQTNSERYLNGGRKSTNILLTYKLF